MQRRRVLITTPWLSSGCEAEDILRRQGFDVAYADSLGAAERPEAVDAVIAGTEPLTGAQLRSSPRLAFIVRTGVGYDNVDVDAATGGGIAVSTTPGSNRMSVAELVIGLVFDCARQISNNVGAVRAGRWERESGTEIGGAVLGIVGLGSIGKAVARLAQGVGMTVVASDPFIDEEFTAAHGIETLPLDVLLRTSDYVTLHMMLSEETHHLIDAASLATMKSSAYLINTSRGGVVDERALAQALRSGRIAGAALDVLEQEPLEPESELRGIDNLLITAHIAGATVESRDRSARSAAEQILDFFSGRPPVGLVNPDYRFALTDRTLGDVA